MNFRISTSLVLLATIASMDAQTTESKPSSGIDIVDLEKLVVTGTSDAKTLFDLAQGASVLSDAVLRQQRQGTLGETLATLPGVNATYYGPGASRPLIRGLGGDRVRMLDNGVGSLDASNVSPDHNTSIEPLLVERIEILRGPATLLYGSSAVGGVVNVIDNRIPAAPAAKPSAGALEARFDTAARERSGVFSSTFGNGTVALQVNGVSTTTDDLKIPGVAQDGPEAPENQPEGVLPSSATSTKSGSVGLSFFGTHGNMGAAVSRYETDYGVPTGDDPAISISMRQNRLDLRGSLTGLPGAFTEAEGRLGFGDYTHSEIGGGTEVHTTFKNRAYEGRLELQQAKAGALSGTVGIQTSGSRFSAVGEEVVTPPTNTRNYALFALEAFTLSPALRFEFGARAETQTISLGDVPKGLPAFEGYAVSSGETHREEGTSFSAGTVFNPDEHHSLALSVAYSERLPVAQELFSNGPHGGTGAYEVGTPGLGKEKSLGVDLNLRRRHGRLTGSASLFVNRFNDFIFEQRLPDGAAPEVNNPDGLTPYRFVATDAFFWGGESELTVHLIDDAERALHLTLGADYVRAEDSSSDKPLPRIPPLRIRASLEYLLTHWQFGVDLNDVQRQNRFSDYETATPGYALLGARIGYHSTYSGHEYEVFLRATNLADEEARVHTSFLKDFAPLAGRNVLLGVRYTF